MALRFDISPAVSVVVPAYNAARTLPATLASARAQSLELIEIIVVDDGSTDTTAAWLHSAMADEPRLRVIHQRNSGVSAARNSGLLAARADLIAFLDSDDLWPLDHLGVHVGLLARHPGIGVSFSTARLVDASGREIGRARPPLKAISADMMIRTNPTTTTSSWVVRRKVFDQVGLFDATLRRSEDQEWLVRAALAGVGIEGTTMSMVSYRTAVSGLAGDLAAMREGFVAMLDRVGRRNPELIAACGAAALAAEDRYLARQALRLKLPKAIARRYICDALSADPSLLWRSPRGTIGTLLAAHLPGAWPPPRLKRGPTVKPSSVYEV